MKMIRKIATTVLPIAAMIVMTACSSSDDSGGGLGGGGGSSPLATGGFIKEVAKGGTDSWSAPFSQNDYRAQQLVHATDIKGSGYIESFRFKSELTEVETNCPDITIKMGHTGLSELTTTFTGNVEQGKGAQQTIFDGNLTIEAVDAGDFFTIVLDEPFYYNGIDNLVMDFILNQGCSNGITIMADATTHANATLWNATSTNPTGTLYDHTQNVQLNFEGGVNTQDYGGTTSNSWPFSDSLPHTQNLYTASDINGSGPITGLGFQVNATTVEETYTATIKMGHTALSDLQTIYADNSTGLSAITTDVNFTVPAGLTSGEWFWVPLTSSFNYNGTNNLLVDIEVTGATGATTLRNTGMPNAVRAWGSSGSATATATDGVAIHTKFRFNGATMDVMAVGSNTTSGQVLGNSPSGGQIQNLYKNTDLGTSGKVSAVYVQLKNNAIAATVSGHKIYIGHTNKTSLDAVDPYVDNMDNYVLAYSATTDVPNTLKGGDWLRIPLTTTFNYDATKNLTILFLGTTDAQNVVTASLDTTRLSTASVGRNDNSVDPESGQPSWTFDGMVDIRLELQK